MQVRPGSLRRRERQCAVVKQERVWRRCGPASFVRQATRTRDREQTILWSAAWAALLAPIAERWPVRRAPYERLLQPMRRTLMQMMKLQTSRATRRERMKWAMLWSDAVLRSILREGPPEFLRVGQGAVR